RGRGVVRVGRGHRVRVGLVGLAAVAGHGHVALAEGVHVGRVVVRGAGGRTGADGHGRAVVGGHAADVGGRTTTEAGGARTVVHSVAGAGHAVVTGGVAVADHIVVSGGHGSVDIVSGGDRTLPGSDDRAVVEGLVDIAVGPDVLVDRVVQHGVVTVA